MAECAATAPSMGLADQDHVHTCTGNHDDLGDHFCGVCLRYWWVRPPQ